ncbi:MAG: 2-hydroxy-3-oxopropionate reductase [Defluviitaleaceae bacterium]|nr:2-hydroxy-3-oxopropionate reductase [Defluviitaleaceae bacterium]
MKIGFIGLGIMGRPMAKNLLKAGYELYVYDIVPENMREIAAAGAKACSSIKETTDHAEIILIMVPDSPQVEEVTLGAGGLFDHAKPGTLVVDMSSIAPLVSQKVGAALAEKSIRFMDAPVSGGEPKAIDGTLSFMVGGMQEDFAQAEPVLKHMGASVVLVGALGSGNTTKLANQIIVALNIAAVSEAFALATKAGVDPRAVFDAIKGGLAGSTVMNAKVPMILDGNFKPGFKIDLHSKDLTNALDTAENLGVPLLLTAQVFQAVQYLRGRGEGQSDHSATAKFYEALYDVEIRK